MSKLIYGELQGAQKILNVYDDHISLTQIKNMRSILTNNWFQGEKQLFYYDITSIQYRPASSFILGYIQFEVPGIRSVDNFNSENSWTFGSSFNDIAKEICDYVRNRIREIKQPNTINSTQVKLSPADEQLLGL